MSGIEHKDLIATAKERALFGFLALVQRALQDTDQNMVQLLSGAKSSLDQSALMSVRHFVRQDGNVFLRRIDTLFRSYFDRAMQTMYVDLRAGMRKKSANELSLIDDETVNHQIEVGRLTERMRGANEESIGRLNAIIATVHGQSEAKERENPFRPYLLARALYEAVKEVATDEAMAKILFQHLADAMIQHLPSYYSAIREVFEAAGIQGKFITKPTRRAFYQRHFGEPPMPANVLPSLFATQIAPVLQRILETIQTGGMQDNKGSIGEGREKAATVQEFIQRMVAPSRTSPPSSTAAKKEGNQHPIAAQLTQIQKKIANGEEAGGKTSQGENWQLELRKKLDLEKASTMDRLTVEVVNMLFSFILEDEQIPADLRHRIGRLQLPILKAAILDPDLMHCEDHPARQLLNRMSSATVGVDSASDAGQKLASEIDRIVDRIFEGFDDDISIFATALGEFEGFLADAVCKDNTQIMRAIEAVEAAEKISILLANATHTLCDLLVQLNTDKRVSDFIIAVWPHVLVRAAWSDAENKIPPTHEASEFLAYRNALPELLWSIQEKAGQDRTALIRMLPDLLKRLTQGLQLIKLPADEIKNIMDQLVTMHAQVLRTTKRNDDAPYMEPNELRQIFSRLVIQWQRVSWEEEEPLQVREDALDEAFARYGIAPLLHAAQSAAAPSAEERTFLQQAYLLGTKVDMCGADGNKQAAQLIWVSTHRSLYLFRQKGDGTMVIHTYASLLESLRKGAIVPVEYAPVFDRAVDSLLFSAEKVQAAAV